MAKTYLSGNRQQATANRKIVKSLHKVQTFLAFAAQMLYNEGILL